MLYTDYHLLFQALGIIVCGYHGQYCGKIKFNDKKKASFIDNLHLTHTH